SFTDKENPRVLHQEGIRLNAKRSLGKRIVVRRHGEDARLIIRPAPAPQDDRPQGDARHGRQRFGVKESHPPLNFVGEYLRAAVQRNDKAWAVLARRRDYFIEHPDHAPLLMPLIALFPAFAQLEPFAIIITGVLAIPGILCVFTEAEGIISP